MSEPFFSIPNEAEWQTIILAPYGADPLAWTFHAQAAVRGGRTKIFPKRGTLGPTDFDRDDTLSTANWSDLSGGSGIAVINPSTDMGKSWWHVADARGTDGWTCPPEAISSRPGTYSGNHVPVGRIGASTYGLWGTAIHKWDPATRTWGNAVATIGTVVNSEGIVSFNDAMYFPLGSSGYAYVAESAPGTLGSVTTVAGAAAPTANSPVPTSNPRVWAFAVHQQKLWAITTSADGHVLASNTTGASGNWFWPYDDARGTFIKISTSTEPKTLFQFLNTQQERQLWCSSKRGCLIWDPLEMTWQESNLWDVPPHPDFGRCAKVFRPGEAVWIASGGGDLIQYQSNGTVVPASGPGGAGHGLPDVNTRLGDGMPASKRGSVVSMATDLANLFLLVQGEQAVGASDDVLEEDDASDPITIPGSEGQSSVIAWTGKGFHPLWESTEPLGTATKIVVSDALDADGNTDYRAFWGTGEDSWSMPCRLTTHSSRQAVDVGNVWRFATSGYIELGEFWAGSFAVHKLASHISITMAKANAANYAEYEYQTDHSSLGQWTTLGIANEEEPGHDTVLGFNLSDDGLWVKGQHYHWIKQRIRLYGAGGTTSPVVRGISLAYLPLPQDAATKTYAVQLPTDVSPKSDMTREQIEAKLEALLSAEEFVYLKHQHRTYRAYVASVANTEMLTRDGWGIANVTVIQIPSGVHGTLGDG